jgi:hypothetical protein
MDRIENMHPTVPLLLHIYMLLQTPVYHAIAWQWLPLFVALFQVSAVMSQYLQVQHKKLC